MKSMEIKNYEIFLAFWEFFKKIFYNEAELKNVLINEAKSFLRTLHSATWNIEEANFNHIRDYCERMMLLPVLLEEMKKCENVLLIAVRKQLW